jgi:hypothetical protein
VTPRVGFHHKVGLPWHTRSMFTCTKCQKKRQDSQHSTKVEGLCRYCTTIRNGQISPEGEAVVAEFKERWDRRQASKRKTRS